MPEYLLLIYSPTDHQPDPAEMPRWGKYTMDLQAAGVMVGGNALQGPDTATTVRVRDGQTQVTDGPFAETKESLGGYYLIDAPDLDTALDHASRMPNIAYGCVEVRPIFDTSQIMEESGAAQAES